MADEVREIEVINYAGEPGSRVLSAITSTDIGLIAGWEGVGGEGGNCFFASVQAMVNLIGARSASGFEIVTGIFNHPDRPTPVIHGWLEHHQIVLNVANLGVRPLYAAVKRDYYASNFCNIRIQRIEPGRVARMVKKCDGDVREATKRLLKPTFSVRWRMIQRNTGISKNRLLEIAAIPDDQIDTSDIPEQGEEFFKKAKIVRRTK